MGEFRRSTIGYVPVSGVLWLVFILTHCDVFKIRRMLLAAGDPWPVQPFRLLNYCGFFISYPIYTYPMVKKTRALIPLKTLPLSANRSHVVWGRWPQELKHWRLGTQLCWPKAILRCFKGGQVNLGCGLNTGSALWRGSNEILLFKYHDLVIVERL